MTLDGWVDGAQSKFIPRGQALGTYHMDTGKRKRKWKEGPVVRDQK